MKYSFIIWMSDQVEQTRKDKVSRGPSARCHFKPCKLEATRFLHESESGHGYSQWCDFHMDKITGWRSLDDSQREVSREEFLIGEVLES